MVRYRSPCRPLLPRPCRCGSSGLAFCCAFRSLGIVSKAAFMPWPSSWRSRTLLPAGSFRCLPLVLVQSMPSGHHPVPAARSRAAWYQLVPSRGLLSGLGWWCSLVLPYYGMVCCYLPRGVDRCYQRRVGTSEEGRGARWVQCMQPYVRPLRGVQAGHTASWAWVPSGHHQRLPCLPGG